MIRECRSDDFGQLMKISSMEVMDNDLTNTIKDAKNFIVWDDLGIKGFAYMSLGNEEKREWIRIIQPLFTWD